MLYEQDHLKITKVRTVDGITPLFDEQRRPLEKVIYAPDTALTRKTFDDQNSRLPEHLKMKIERFKKDA